MIRFIYSKQRFSAKPIDKGVISALQKPKNYDFAEVDDVEGIAKIIGRGHAWRAGIYSEGQVSFKKANVIGAQILALDFDSCPTAPEEIIQYSESIGIRPSAWYYSYSQGKKEGHNFRVLWVLDEIIKGIQYETIYKNLLEQFAPYNPDKSTKDASRLWFGTVNGVNVVNKKPLPLSAIGWLGVCEKLKQGQTVQKAKKAVKGCEKEFFEASAEAEEIKPFYITKKIEWWDELQTRCWLWDKWVKGKYLNYNQRLTLFTNLKYLKYSDTNLSMISKVLEYYEKYKSTYEGHTCDEEQIRRMFLNTTLRPLGIVNVGEDEPITVVEYFRRGNREVINTVDKITISELDKMLDEQMPQLLDDEGIVYIKSQTASGKTHRVIQWLLRQDLRQKKVIYSAPRYNIIQEFEERFKAAYAAAHSGEPLFDEGNIDVIKVVPRGNYTSADVLLMELGFPAATRQSERYKAIQEMIDPNSKGLFVCSHQCIAHLKTCPADCIIIDENIEEALLDVVKLDSVGIAALIPCVKEEYSDIVLEFTKKIDSLERGATIDIEPLRKAIVDGFDWNKYISSKKIMAGIAKLTEIPPEPPKITEERGNKAIRFVTRSSLISEALEKETPIKFLSATPKPARLSTMYNTDKIMTYPFPLAKNEGKIVQYLSLSGAKGNKYTMGEKIEDLIKYIRRKIPQEELERAYVLTFKDSIPIWKMNGFRIPQFNGEDIHLANNSGLDFLKGEIVIIAGKFDEASEKYEDIYFDLHPEATEKPDRGWVNVESANRIRKIWLYTDKELSEIQQETIKLYLEQSTGRARALREKGAIVYLFANYPIDDADIYYDN